MKKIILSILTISFFVFISCKKDEIKDNNSMLTALAIVASSGGITEIPFTLVSGTDTAPFKCNKVTAGHLTSQRHISESLNFYLKDARLFVHDVKLVRADGSTADFTLTADTTFQSSSVALLDFEDKTGDCSGGTTETNTTLKGSAPFGVYVGVQFKIGVPEAQNSLLNTTAAAPLNASGMYWAWASGYKFLKFEWKTTEGAGATGTYHLGAAGTCTGGSGAAANLSCQYPNIPTVTLKTVGNVAWSPSKNPVYLDAKTLVNGTNTNVADGGASLTCMGNANTSAGCKVLLTNLGVNQADGKTLATQSAFYLKP